MAKNLRKYFTKGEVNKFKYEEFWFRTILDTEVYLISIITSDRLYIEKK